MTQSPLEIPQQMRDMAKTTVDQSRAAFDQFMDAMVGAMAMWGPSNQMTSGFKAIQDRTMSFTKQNADSMFALAGDVAAAKDFQEVLSLQSRYAHTQMQSYTLQSHELGRLMTAAAQDWKPST